MHGEDDVHIPFPNVEALYGACTTDLCRLERRPGDDHLSLITDEASWSTVRAFFDETLAG